MKSKITQYIAAGMIALFGVVGISAFQVAPAYAACNTPACQVNQGTKAAGADSENANIGDKVKLVINLLLFIIGAVSVIMIILGGLRYVLSNGDSSQVTSAKNTILYAVIGLVVALLAYAIVNFVVKQFTK
jgi:uncharacterized membrane protein YjfL (UPF0719 family)